MPFYTVKAQFAGLDTPQLIQLIGELYKASAQAKQYLDFYAQPDEAALLEKYKLRVREAFRPKRGYDIRLKDGKQAISGFKKLGTTPAYLAALMLYYVEAGVETTLLYGDMYQGFYSSLETTCEAALKLMAQNGLLPNFAGRMEKLVRDAG